MKKLFNILVLILMSTVAMGIGPVKYYVSSTGNNANNGLTPATAWQTIGKINSYTFAAGDTIAFKRGDVFYGAIVTNRPGIIIDAYGTGVKPKVTGLSTVTGWVSVGLNLWEAPVTGVKPTVKLVLRNNVPQQIGRYPNTTNGKDGWITPISASTSTTITGPALSTTTNWTGAEIAIRHQRWDMITHTVSAHSGGVVTFNNVNNDVPKVGFGYFFQRDARTLDQDGEWYYNNSTSKLRVYSIINPASYKYQISTIDTLCFSVYNNFTISNITFEGANKNALKTYGGTVIRINNVDVINSGDEAITCQSSANVIVDGCTTVNSLGSGIYVENAGANAGLTVKNCTVDSTSLIMGLEASFMFNGGEGILVRGGTNLTGFTTVTGNRIKNSAYNGISWYGNNAVIEKNFVDSFCTRRDDGSGIYTSSVNVYTAGLSQNKIVRYNIVDHGLGNNLGTNDPTGGAVNGLYADDGSQVIFFDDNTVANVVGGGTHGNDNDSIWFRRNTFYNTYKGVTWQRLRAAPRLVRHLTVTGNIVYPYRFEYRNIHIDVPTLITFDADVTALGVIDSNYYYLKPGIDTGFFGVSRWTDGSNFQDKNGPFSYMVSRGHETHSIRVNSTNLPSILKYNASDTSIVYAFAGLSKKDPQGNTYNNSVTIPAWSSKILIDNGSVANILPIANAGADQVVTQPINSTTLNGSSSTDPDGVISSWLWTKVSGPVGINFGTNTNPILSVDNLVAGGVYKFELKVTDNSGGIARDTVQVTSNGAPNTPPTANAGVDKTITLPTNGVTVTVSGTDSDGSIVIYTLTKISGPTGGTVNSTITPTIFNVVSLQQGVYLYELEVTDNNGATDKDTMQVTVNPGVLNIPPTSSAGADITIQLPDNDVIVTGVSNDVDGIVSGVTWLKVSGPSGGVVVSPTSPSTSIIGLLQGTYKYQFIVSDDSGAVVRDTMQITVLAPNILPTVNAGANEIVQLPANSVLLMATASDADGMIVSYEWSKVSGPVGTNFGTNTNASLPVNNLVQGTYQFSVKVKDNSGDSAIDIVQVQVNPPLNISPTANAGSPQTIVLPVSQVTMAGSGTDIDGTIQSYFWLKVSGPAAGIITNTASPTTTITGLTLQGQYTYRLTVTDNNGAFSHSSVIITVSPAIVSPTGVTEAIIYNFYPKL